MRARVDIEVVSQGGRSWQNVVRGDDGFRGPKRVQSHGQDRKIDDENDRQTQQKKKPFTLKSHALRCWRIMIVASTIRRTRVRSTMAEPRPTSLRPNV